MNNVSMKLSEHFSLAEMCKTSANLDNVPNEAQVENLKRLCGWLEMLRSEWNKRYGEGNDPIFINSGFRSEAVNKAVGGVKGSNHLSGCAADIRVAGIEQLVRYATILLDISDESKVLAPLRRPSLRKSPQSKADTDVIMLLTAAHFIEKCS